MRNSELWSPRPTKGFHPSGHRVISFDAVRVCNREKCRIAGECPYAGGLSKCAVEIKFLDAVQRDLLAIPGNKLSQDYVNKVTLHLMPLYHQLIKFQIRAYMLDDVLYQGAQGVKVHPIFKAIKETIGAIEATQRSMGIDMEYHRALQLRTKGVKGRGRKEQDEEIYGDAEYAEVMEAEVGELRGTDSNLFPEGKRGRAEGGELLRRRVVREDREEGG